MATGLPKAQWQSRTTANGVNGGSTDVRLDYEGKKSEREILLTPSADCRQLWPEHSSHEINRLYFGDNLSVLAALTNDPDVLGKVRLVYIDPPYATKSVFQSRNQTDAYMDLLEGAHYLEFLRERLIFLRELLADDGSIYVHLDDNMAFHAKALMDEVFGRGNFRSWITRKKCNPKNYTRKTYGNVADYILFYSKTENYVWHRPVDSWSEEKANKEYQYVEAETGRRYKKVPVHAPGVRNGETGQLWRGVKPPPGKHWQYPPRVLDEMDARGEIYWSPTGNPRRKIYLDESNGVAVQDIWLDFRDAHNQNIAISGYPTEKNSALLTRIIEASSNKGDLVLDCFSGSGTTLNVASLLGRRWIGVDNSSEAITATLRRFGKGLEPMGDFVNKPVLTESDETESPADSFPLFQRGEDKLQKIPRQHQPIRDFAVFAQEPYQGELKASLQEWNKWAGEEKYLRLAETSSPRVQKLKRSIAKKVKYVIRRKH
ncbi:MAG: site-specific DNA-methyltransferase [Verrucomicrobia bacterium]|nr:site-specific DNA-methyltransferase [Verrucomicrobiota bacterium]